MLTEPDTQALLYGERKGLGNKFCLITLVRKRAENLVDGSPRLVDVDTPNAVSVALFEIQEGKVVRRDPSSPRAADAQSVNMDSIQDSQAAALATALGIDL